MKSFQVVIVLLLLATIMVSAYYYDEMPEYMASHWNASGEVDGYMEKGVALYLIPAIAVFVVLVFYIIPHIDPLKENIKQFEQYYEGFVFVLMLFLAYVQLLSLAWNLGYEFDMGRMMTPGLGVLFIYLGIMCGQCKRNWFIGIRTPWTLSSDKVWEKTHTLAEKLFVFLGVLWIVVGLLWPALVPYMIGLLILGALWLFVYSYLEYRKGEGAVVKPGSLTAAKKCAAETAGPLKVLAEPVKKKAVKKRKAPAKKKKATKKKDSEKAEK